MDFTGLIGFRKLPVIMATCGNHSSSPTARGASGWHDGLSPGLPRPRAGARPRPVPRGRSPQPPGARPRPVPRGGLARLAREGGWRARGAGAPGPRGGLARAGGWRAWPARGAGTPGLARRARPCAHRPGPRGDTTRSSWPPPSKTFKKNYLKLKFGTEAWKNPI